MVISNTNFSKAICEIAIAAGEEILSIYNGDFEVLRKNDESPVTKADTVAETLILERLRKLSDNIPIVAEEEYSSGVTTNLPGDTFWLVDPLDGTKEFVSRNGEFTVNIALIVDAKPQLGVVHLPVTGQTYWTDGSHRAWHRQAGQDQAISSRTAPTDGIVAILSRSHVTPETEQYLAAFDIKEKIKAGSSLKFCKIAEGKADIYPRLGTTMEWDIAAGHAVLAASGGSVCRLDGLPLLYGKAGFRNPHFVAKGDANL